MFAAFKHVEDRDRRTRYPAGVKRAATWTKIADRAFGAHLLDGSGGPKLPGIKKFFASVAGRRVADINAVRERKLRPPPCRFRASSVWTIWRRSGARSERLRPSSDESWPSQGGRQRAAATGEMSRCEQQPTRFRLRVFSRSLHCWQVRLLHKRRRRRHPMEARHSLRIPPRDRRIRRLPTAIPICPISL